MEILYRAFIYSEKYRMEIIGLFFSISFVMGMVIYATIYHLNIVDSISYSLGLFAMDVKTPSEIVDIAYPISSISSYWRWIFFASILAKATVLLGVFLLFFRSALSTWYRKKIISNGGHTIVIGLGRNSRFFINSMVSKYPHRTIIFEVDEQSPYVDRYRNKKVSMVLKDVDTMLNDLNLENVENVFIATGSDEKNIYYALQFIGRLEENEGFGKLLIHIEDRTLRNLYSDDGALKSSSIDIKLFSYYKDSARFLFQEHPLEGVYDEARKDNIIDTATGFEIVVIGNSELSISVVAEACRLAHYPNNNALTIYCIDKDIKSLMSKFFYAFPELEKKEGSKYNIANISLEFIELESASLEFYKHKVWNNTNIKHVICCYDDIVKNISIVSKLKDVTYLALSRVLEDDLKATLKCIKSKFHVATMHHKKVGKKIEDYNKSSETSNLFTFAQADVICSQENLLCNRIDNMAKMMHYCYESNHFRTHKISIKESAMDSLWKKASVYEKKSSMGQAIHVDSKLRMMKLQRVKRSVKTEEEQQVLREDNKKVLQKIFSKEMNALGLTENTLDTLQKNHLNRKKIKEVTYFPKKYELFFEQMLRMEHNRWMALLQLIDTVYDKRAKDLSKKHRIQWKVHHLLKPFEKFETAYEKAYIINDINTLFNIADYMALTGYAIVDSSEH